MTHASQATPGKVTKLNRIERNAWTKQKIFDAATKVVGQLGGSLIAERVILTTGTPTRRCCPRQGDRCNGALRESRRAMLPGSDCRAARQRCRQRHSAAPPYVRTCGTTSRPRCRRHARRYVVGRARRHAASKLSLAPSPRRSPPRGRGTAPSRPTPRRTGWCRR